MLLKMVKVVVGVLNMNLKFLLQMAPKKVDLFKIILRDTLTWMEELTILHILIFTRKKAQQD